MLIKISVSFISAGLFMLALSVASARMLADIQSNPPLFSAAQYQSRAPDLQQCTHKVGRLWLTISNYGIFGNQGNYFLRDCLTGQASSAAEFPGGSNIGYLKQGSLWIGAVVDGDTNVHFGTDGWRNVRHFFPDEGISSDIIKRSSNPQSPFYHTEAVSDLDLVATFYDTLTSPIFNAGNPDPEDSKVYRPLGLKIVQNSYSWATGWGQDFLLFDYRITNFSKDPIREAYVGIFVDPDIGHPNTPNYEKDDLAGLVRRVSSETGVQYCVDTLDLAYAQDNDGDPMNGAFGTESPKAALGVRVLRVPGVLPRIRLSFNWWLGDSSGLLDWGPQQSPGRASTFGTRGQPIGSGMKYYYLSNHELDYDQVFSAIDQSSKDAGFGIGWLSPLASTLKVDAANGADTRLLLTYGPFDIGVGESLPFTFALLAGDGFHQAPDNFEQNLGASLNNYSDPGWVGTYQQGLNFNSLIENSKWAARIFDNPLPDSSFVRCTTICVDAAGNCDVVFDFRKFGDGVPDFKGPSPPPNPSIRYFVREGEITVRWFGKETETSTDPFTLVKDFEGYKVHLSNDGYNFTTIGHYDRIDWKPYILVRKAGEWQWVPSPTPPLTYDQIQQLYAVHWDRCRNSPDSVTHPIDPNKFNAPAYIVTQGDLPPRDLTQCLPDTSRTYIRITFGQTIRAVDTTMYFVPHGYNLGLDQPKLYPSVTDVNNDSAYWYEYKLSGLFPSDPVYLAIIPFDFGHHTPTVRIDPQEYIPSTNAKVIYPFPSDSQRIANKLKISVYPNPYRIDHNYSHYEKPKINEGVLASTQKLNFINLPPKCTIRIYTLDGDLVQQINHDKTPNATDAGFETWDMLTRNAQKVVAGMYIFSVESSEGRYIGKILIIQ